MFDMTSPATATSSPVLAAAAAAGSHAPRGACRAPEPEFRAQFDQDYRAALEEAGRTLELAGVLDTVEHWRDASVDYSRPGRTQTGRAPGG